MVEIRTVTTLIAKRDAIERAVKGYEAALAQAHFDLAALNATIAHFQRADDKGEVTPYFDLHRLFKRGEMFKIARAAMEAEGELSTTELANRVIACANARAMFPIGNKLLRSRRKFPIGNIALALAADWT